MTKKKKVAGGAIKLVFFFLLFFFFSSRLLSGALAVMVDRKEIKRTIYSLLWGWARESCRLEVQDAPV